MKETKPQKTYDVIISGAGPVGLFLACELSLAGCSVLILEQAESADSPLKRMPFGIRGLSAPTIEALNRRGLLGELEIHRRLKDPHRSPPSEKRLPPRRRGGHFAGLTFLESDVDSSKWRYRLPSSPPTNLLSEMRELETVLTRRAETLGVEIRRGFPVTDFQEIEDGVIVRSGDCSFKGRWLAGCDGARSAVRKLGGFEFAGTEPQFTGYSTLIDIDGPEKLREGRNVTAAGMYMQSQPGYVIIQDFDGGAFHDSKKPVTIEHVRQILRRVSQTDVNVTALHTAATWTDRARQATRYRRGRVLLAGDAAHIHSPLGGQGLNLGLGDAMNLGWKLARSVQCKAPEGLLDTYESERHPIGEQVLEWSRAQVAVMKPTPEARALRAVLRDLIETRDGATYFAGRVWGVETRYDLGGDHPLVGAGAPNFELEDGATVDESMRDGRGLLLDFNGNRELEILAQEYGETLKYVSSRARENFGLSAALIRPDGIVAWASDGEVHQESLGRAVSLWFVR